MSVSQIAQSFDECERIGVIGSPSSTGKLAVDLLGTAVDKRLVGSLCVFKYNQDSTEHYALGQISEVRLHNPWTEDPTMRGLIRQKGIVDPVTEKQDTHNATIFVSAVFSRGSATHASMLGTVPPTGTSVRLVSEKLLFTLLADYSEQLFYLGHAYGTNILLPMWFKHFGVGLDGAGEAYHIGVFGKTGSGKSVLAKMLLLGYARHKEMSIIVLDPQGEFSKLKDDKIVMETMHEKYKRDLDTYDLSSVVLTDSQGFHLFGEILKVSGFLEKLSVFHDDNKSRAVRQIVQAINDVPEKPKPWELFAEAVFDRVWRALGTRNVQANIYSMQELVGRMAASYDSANRDEFYEIWAGIARLFSNDKRVKHLLLKDLISKVVTGQKGSIVIIDLAEQNVPAFLFWNEKIRSIVINRVLETLKAAAEKEYKQNKLLNTLVIIDEAHRLAPRYQSFQRGQKEDEHLSIVRRTLIDGALTTRKFGLGWMFISPTLSSIDSEVLGQLRVELFGFGLGWGAELRSLKEIIGGNDEAISLYQGFKDPQSVLGEHEYSFMAVGPISPLSFSGSPLFFTALKYPDEFVKLNRAKGSFG